MQSMEENIARWEDDGGKTWKPEEKQSYEGGASLESGMLVEREQRNELLKAMQKMTLRQATSHREYIMTSPRRDYIDAEVISVSPGASLDRVLRVLAQHKISCVPVIEQGGEAFDISKPGVFKGFVDVLDIVTFLSSAIRHDDTSEPQVLSTLIGSLIDRSHKDVAYPFHQDLPTTAVLEPFAKGVHRVPLFDDHKGVAGLCSQYDIICYMSDLFEQGTAIGMGLRAVQQYKELLAGGHWGVDAVVWVAPSVTLREALQKMATSGLTAMAVVDEGVLVGQISAVQLMAYVPTEGPIAMAQWLGKTVEAFLDANKDRVGQPIFELPEATLQSICKTMAEYHVHNVWLVDGLESMHPVGVITMTDICRIVRYFQWPAWFKEAPGPTVVEEGAVDTGPETYIPQS